MNRFRNIRGRGLNMGLAIALGIALGVALDNYAIGIAFEDVWLERIRATNPNMRVVHTEAGIEKLPMSAEDQHGDKGRTHQSFVDAQSAEQER